MLPPPYDDEVFYSVIARGAEHLGLHDAPSLNQFVFGMLRIVPSIDIPPRLDALLPRILPGSPYTPEIIVGRHSLFPYYSAFLEPDKADAAYTDVLTARSIAANARLTIPTIQMHLRLRFCTKCVEVDVRQGREPYWRRVHQAPGCLVCPDHRCMLREGPSIRGNESAQFISLSRVIEEGQPTSSIISDAPRTLLVRIAKSSVDIMSRSDPTKGANLLPSFFEHLRERGWSKGQRVSSTRLMEHVRQQLGPDILRQIGIHHHRYNPMAGPATLSESTDWLGRCLRARGKVRHPLPYLLILAALDEGPSVLLSHAPSGQSPLGQPALPAPCGNPVCPAYDPPVPRPLKNVKDSGMFVISCRTCGYTYRQSAGATEAKRKRIVDFGHLWDDALCQECVDGTATKLELEGRLGASTETIKRRAAKIGVWHPRWGEQTRAYIATLRESEWLAKREVSREEYRNRWLELANSNPSFGRRALGRLDEVTYCFLRTFDVDWLNETTPYKPRGYHGEPTAASKDRDLASQIEKAADALEASAIPTWVNQKSIARHLGRTMLQLHQSRMPKSWKALKRRAETLAQFRARSIKLLKGDASDGEQDEPFASGSATRAVR